MPLPIIEEGIVLDTFSNTNNGSRPLGHNAFYGASSDDTPSIFSHSTNSTASNLPGPGRVLGNFYSSTGRRLERTLGELAHKAGFGPEATYQQISTLYLEDWKMDDKKASMLQKLCFKLLEHSSSVVDSTRFSAIMRWGDILRNHHELYVWLFCAEKKQMAKHTSALLRTIEELQSTINSLSDFQDAVLSDTLLLIKYHSMGLNFINLSRARFLLEGGRFHLDWWHWSWTGKTDINREEIEQWDVPFQYLLESLSDPTVSALSRWYIDFWSSQIVRGDMHPSFALQSCLTLRSLLKVVDPSHTDRRDTLAVLGKKMYEYFVGRSHSRVMLLARWDDFLPCDGIPIHISTILNDLVRSYNHVFSPGLDTVPDLTCITMPWSTDFISANVKETIRGFLKGLQNDDEGKDKTFTKLMLLRSCYRLLKRALSELNDTECFDKLSKVTRFTDGTSRCAILQLGDILQSLPEVYMLLITLGGDEIRDSVESLRRSLKVSITPPSEDIFHDLPPEAIEFIRRTASFDRKTFREDRDHFVPYLMDNVTFNPLIFYLKHGINQFLRARNDRYSFLSCSIVHSALLTEKSIPQENRSAMEELCRTMQNLIIVQLRSSVELSDFRYINVMNLIDALRSVYMDITEARHVRTFEDDAEVYLSQLCDLIFKSISETKHMEYKRKAFIRLSDFFRSRNILGWFLSIRGPDAEASIARLLEDIDDSNRFVPKKMQCYTVQFSHLEAHKLGVELLAPRYEKLHFEGAGLTKHVCTRSSEPPLTPEQRGRWINAFKTLVANLSSGNSDLIDISLFYFANCPLPYKTKPMLDTTLALDYCEKLQLVLSKVKQYKSTNRNIKPEERILEELWNNLESRILMLPNKENLSRAVYHIHTCLTKQVECVQQPCMDVTRSVHTFYGVPFDVPKVIRVLTDLAKLYEEKLGSDAPGLKLLPISTADRSEIKNYSYPRRHWVKA